MKNGFGFGFGFMRRDTQIVSGGGGGSGPQPYSGTIREVNGDGGSAATGILFRDENNSYWTGDATARYTTLAAAQTAATAGDTIVCTKAENLGSFTVTKSLKFYAAESVASHGFIGTNSRQMATMTNVTVNEDSTFAGLCFFPTSAGLKAVNCELTVAMCNFWLNNETGIWLNSTAPTVTSRANVFYVVQGSIGRAFWVHSDGATLTSRCDTASTYGTTGLAAIDRDGYEGSTVDVQGMIALGNFGNGAAFNQGTLDSWGDTDYDVTTDTSSPGLSGTTGVPLTDYMTRIDGAGSVFYPKSAGQYDKYSSGIEVPFTNDQRERGQDYAGALESIGFQNVFDTDTAQFDSEIVSGATPLSIKASTYLGMNAIGEAIMWAKAANYNPAGQSRLACFARFKCEGSGGDQNNLCWWFSADDSGTLSDNAYRIELKRDDGVEITRYNDGSGTSVYSTASYAMGSSFRNCYCHVLINGDGVYFRFSANGDVPTVVDTSDDRHTNIKRAGVGANCEFSATSPRIYLGTFA